MLYELIPATKEYLWGGKRLKEQFSKDSKFETIAESWELSAHIDGECVIAQTGENLSKHIRENSHCLGKNCSKSEALPVLVKLIDAKEKLSIQVHPNDKFALINENQFGKTEMWYILDSEPGAYIYYGLKKDLTKEAFIQAVNDGTICDKLNKIYVKKGDVFFIKAGTIHGIGAGCLVAEVQQNSNVTYRIYDFDRKDSRGNSRELHLQKALEVADLTAVQMQNSCDNHIAKCKYFTVDLIALNNMQEDTKINIGENSFFHFLIIDGEVDFLYNKGKLTAKKGSSIFAQANSGEVLLKGSAQILATYIEKETYRVGVDLGGTNINAGVLNGDNEILSTYSIPTNAHRTWEEIASDIAQAVRCALEVAEISIDDCIGIGIGSPGTVNSKTGVVIYSNNFNNWNNIPLAETIENVLNKKVYLSNDANCAALGEFVAGAAKNYESTVLITLGTGVGTGFVFNGVLFEGGNVGGAEAGHIVIVENGEQCTCGRKGCFETYASATGLIREGIKAAKKHKDSLLAKYYIENNMKMNGIIPFKAAKANDEVALKVVNAYIRYLSEGIVNLVNVFRPHVVLISGGICGEKEYLTDPINKFVQENAFGGNRIDIPEVKVATLGNNAGVVGAANLCK